MVIKINFLTGKKIFSSLNIFLFSEENGERSQIGGLQDRVAREVGSSEIIRKF